jgi:hypothetical protein
LLEEQRVGAASRAAHLITPEDKAQVKHDKHAHQVLGGRQAQAPVRKGKAAAAEFGSA